MIGFFFSNSIQQVDLEGITLSSKFEVIGTLPVVCNFTWFVTLTKITPTENISIKGTNPLGAFLGTT